MKPFVTIAQARTPEGAELSLHEHDQQFYLRVNRQPLMSTTATESERVMASLACDGLHLLPKARVLIGGLGFGFTLKQVLELVGKKAVVEVAELVPEVIAWNKEHLSHINGKLLSDPRVKILLADVFQVISKASEGTYQAILLDVDNGPVAMVKDGNARLYEREGLASVLRALKPGGIAAFWSASQDKKFAKRLTNAGFKVDVFSAKSHEQARRPSHTIFIGQKKA
jgi:spermidine synthase